MFHIDAMILELRRAIIVRQVLALLICLCVSCAAPVAVSTYPSLTPSEQSSKACRESYAEIDVLGALPAPGHYQQVGFIQTEQYSTSELFYSSDSEQIRAAQIAACKMGADAIVLVSGDSDQGSFWGPLGGVQYKDERSNRIVAIRYVTHSAPSADLDKEAPETKADSAERLRPGYLKGFWNMTWGKDTTAVRNMMTRIRGAIEYGREIDSLCLCANFGDCTKLLFRGSFGTIDSLTIGLGSSGNAGLLGAELRREFSDNQTAEKKFLSFNLFLESMYGKPTRRLTDTLYWYFNDGGSVSSMLSKDSSVFRIRSEFNSQLRDSLITLMTLEARQPDFRLVSWGDSIGHVRAQESAATLDSTGNDCLSYSGMLGDRSCRILYSFRDSILRSAEYQVLPRTTSDNVTSDFSAFLVQKYGERSEDPAFRSQRFIEITSSPEKTCLGEKCRFLGAWALIETIIVLYSEDETARIKYYDRLWLYSKLQAEARSVINDL